MTGPFTVDDVEKVLATFFRRANIARRHGISAMDWADGTPVPDDWVFDDATEYFLPPNVEISLMKETAFTVNQVFHMAVTQAELVMALETIALDKRRSAESLRKVAVKALAKAGVKCPSSTTPRRRSPAS